MSGTATNTLAYTPSPEAESASPALRLTLEPERVDGRQNRATLADIDAMLAMARSGVSARNRQISRCRWASWAKNGDLICTMSLWVWPSTLDLAYSLSLPSGVTSAEPVRVREPRDTKRWVGGSGGEIDLPWLMENARFGWHPRIGTWDGWSRPASPPGISQDGARLIPDGERGVYGVLTARGAAVGWRHEISIRYPTGDDRNENAVNRANPAAPLYIAGGGNAPTAPGISISNADDIDVTATWTDENGETRTEETTLQIPDCVRALLEECPDGTSSGGGSIRVRPAPGNGPVTVYYNTCNGRVLDIRRQEAAP